MFGLNFENKIITKILEQRKKTFIVEFYARKLQLQLGIVAFRFEKYNIEVYESDRKVCFILFWSTDSVQFYDGYM